MAKKKKDKQKTNKRIQKDLKEQEILSQAKNRLLKEKAQSLFTSSFTSRERYDWEWLTRDLFRRGYQFSSYDTKSKTVLITSRTGIQFPINLVWAQMRSVKNQVTSFKPKWEVLASGKSEESVTNAKYSGRLLDYYYQHLNLRKKLKETVMQGLMFSVGGPWQIGYDPDGDNGNGEVYAWLIDTYDFYVDPYATSLEDAEYCGKAVRRTLSEIATNPNYKFYQILPKEGESKLAESPAKQFILQSLKKSEGTAEEEEEEGAILKEVWIKTRVSEENMDDLREELKENEEDFKDLKIGEVLMRIIHYVDFLEDPLLVQLKRTSEFPFVLYQADVNPCEIYGESWIKHIIPVNRVLNALESSVLTYNYRFAIGRVIVDKNSGVRVITNQHGDFVEKNRGAEVRFDTPPPAPGSFQQQINNCLRYIEDLGGSHDISLGRIPTGIKSGIGIAELKQADASNSSDLVDNLEYFLVEVGHKILKEISENYEVPKVIKDLGLGGDVKHFAVVGERGANRRKNKRNVKIGVDDFDLAIIGSNNEVRVTIGSWLAYTKTARQERIKELFNSGLIDQKTALQHLEFSDIDTIIEDVRKEEILKKFRGATAQGAEGEVSDEEIARQENIMMVQEGRDVDPLVTDNHSVHLIVHQEISGMSSNPQLERHMDLHRSLASKSKGEAPSRVEPPMVEPMGAPMGGQGVPGVAPAGVSSEEEALARSLEELKG
jgi:hypothetical protein